MLAEKEELPEERKKSFTEKRHMFSAPQKSPSAPDRWTKGQLIQQHVREEPLEAQALCKCNVEPEIQSKGTPKKKVRLKPEKQFMEAEASSIAEFSEGLNLRKEGQREQKPQLNAQPKWKVKLKTLSNDVLKLAPNVETKTISKAEPEASSRSEFTVPTAGTIARLRVGFEATSVVEPTVVELQDNVQRQLKEQLGRQKKSRRSVKLESSSEDGQEVIPKVENKPFQKAAPLASSTDESVVGWDLRKGGQREQKPQLNAQPKWKVKLKTLSNDVLKLAPNVETKTISKAEPEASSRSEFTVPTAGTIARLRVGFEATSVVEPTVVELQDNVQRQLKEQLGRQKKSRRSVKLESSSEDGQEVIPKVENKPFQKAAPLASSTDESVVGWDLRKGGQREQKPQLDAQPKWKVELKTLSNDVLKLAPNVETKTIYKAEPEASSRSEFTVPTAGTIAQLRVGFEATSVVEPTVLELQDDVQRQLKEQLGRQRKSRRSVKLESSSEDGQEVIPKVENKPFQKSAPLASSTDESVVGWDLRKGGQREQKPQLDAQPKWKVELKTLSNDVLKLAPKVETKTISKAEPESSSTSEFTVPTAGTIARLRVRFEGTSVVEPTVLELQDDVQRQLKEQLGRQRKSRRSVKLESSSEDGHEVIPKVENTPFQKAEPLTSSPVHLSSTGESTVGQQDQQAQLEARPKSKWRVVTQTQFKNGSKVLPTTEIKPELQENPGDQFKKELDVEQPRPEVNVNSKRESNPTFTCRVTSCQSNQVCPCENNAALDDRVKKMETELREKEKLLSDALKKLDELSSSDMKEGSNDVTSEVKIAPTTAAPPPPAPPPPPPPPPPDLTFNVHPQKSTTSTSTSSTLPQGLKPKTSWDVANIKRVHWKPIPPAKLPCGSIWHKVQEEQLITTELLRCLVTKFSTEPASKATMRRNHKKKMQESDLAKLIGELTINFLIGVQKWLKDYSSETIKKNILACNYEAFTVETLNSLLLISPEKLEKIRQAQASEDDLNKIHTTLYQMAGINMLVPRLQSLKFKLQQPEVVGEIKPMIETGIAACKNVFNSGKLKRILELILLFGNIMNSGSGTGSTYAFEMSFLAKLVGVKDTQNKTSLLHFLVDTIEDKYPDLLTFKDELMYVPTATRVSVEAVHQGLKEMEGNICQLKTNLEVHVPQNNEDKFSEVMGLFYKQARKEWDELSCRFKELRTNYNDLADYFALDKKEYNTEHLFRDLKSFIDAFAEVHKMKVRMREAEEARKAKELSRAATLDRQIKQKGKQNFNTIAYRMMAEEDRQDQANGRSGGRVPRRCFVLGETANCETKTKTKRKK